MHFITVAIRPRASEAHAERNSFARTDQAHPLRHPGESRDPLKRTVMSQTHAPEGIPAFAGMTTK